MASQVNAQALKLVEEAYNLIGSRDRWTRRCNARDSDGNQIAFESEHAVRFCALGALSKVGKDKRQSHKMRAYEALLNACRTLYGEHSIVHVNDDDEYGYRDVRRVYRKAMRNLRKAIDG